MSIGNQQGNIGIVDKLATQHDVPKDKGISVLMARELAKEIELSERVKLSGVVAIERYKKQKEGITEVYRNDEFLCNTMLNAIFEEVKFPVPKENFKEFFEDVAKAEKGDVDARNKIQSYFENVDDNVINAILPLYDSYIKDIEEKVKDFGEEVKSEVIEEAKKNFLGQISFPYIESKSSKPLVLQEMDAVERIRAGEKFGKLREKNGVMDGLLSRLDDARITYKKQPPQHPTEQTMSKVKDIYDIVYGTVDKPRLYDTLKTDASREKLKKFTAETDRLSSAIHAFATLVNTPKDDTEDPLQREGPLQRLTVLIDTIKGDVNKIVTLRGGEIKDTDINQAEKIIKDLISKQDLNELMFKAAEEGNFKALKACITLDLDMTHTKDGKTPLEIARKTGELNTTQLKELTELANKSLAGKIDLNNEKHHAIVESYAKEKLFHEYFEFEKDYKAFKKEIKDIKDPLELKIKIKELYDKHIDQIKENPGLNLSDSGGLTLSEILKKNRESILNLSLTDEKVIRDIVNEFDEINRIYPIYLMSPMNVEKHYNEAMGNKCPLHAFANIDNVMSPRKKEEDKKVFNSILPYVDINQKNPEGFTALQIAASKGNRELTKFLLENNAKTTEYKRSPWRKFVDAINRPGKFMENWNKPPPRSIDEIAEISGKTRETTVRSVTSAVLKKEKLADVGVKAATEVKASKIKGPEVKRVLTDPT